MKKRGAERRLKLTRNQRAAKQSLHAYLLKRRREGATDEELLAELGAVSPPNAKEAE